MVIRRGDGRPVRVGGQHRALGVGVIAVLLLGLATLAGCGGTGGAGKAVSGSKAAATPSDSSLPDDMVTITDAWVQAAASGSVPIFGTLVNGTKDDLKVVSATTEAAKKVDLLELTSKKVLRQKQGGFPVPAYGKHIFKPEGDRLMLVDLKQPLKAGDRVSVVLTFDDHSTLQFGAIAQLDATAPVKQPS